MAEMNIFGLAGWSGSGKTTLLTQLLPELNNAGCRVSTIKHAHHSFDIDQPGKDTYVHREAGAHEVMISSHNRWALMHENRGETEPDLSLLLSHMTHVDLVLVEGFKSYPHPKLEIYRTNLGQPMLFGEDKHIVAIATDGPVHNVNLPVFDLEDSVSIAKFILQHCGLSPHAVNKTV